MADTAAPNEFPFFKTLLKQRIIGALTASRVRRYAPVIFGKQIRATPQRDIPETFQVVPRHRTVMTSTMNLINLTVMLL